MMEVEQTLNTWPQLASSVQLGGAATTDVCRRILLNQLRVSGRYYIDLDELIADPQPATTSTDKAIHQNPFIQLNEATIRSIGNAYFQENPLSLPHSIPSESELNGIINAAIAAPSAGNNQPWKWFYQNGRLLLLHDRYRSWSWGDYNEMGALMSLGAAVESASLQSLVYNYKAAVTFVSNDTYPYVAADLFFQPSIPGADTSHKLLLAKDLFNRHTNRKAGTGASIEASIIQAIDNEIKVQQGCAFSYINDKSKLSELGEIIASCDRIRLLHEQGHEEFFHEVRWTHEQALQTQDGIELSSVDVSESDKAGFSVAKDYNAIRYLNEWNLGTGFKKLSVKSMHSASGFGIITVPEFNRENLLSVGQSVLRSWIVANQHQIAFYPMLSPAFFFSRLTHGKGIDIPGRYTDELAKLYAQFQKLCPVSGTPVFMFRLAITNEDTIKTLRMDKQSIFIR
jgi:hypothetical protein